MAVTNQQLLVACKKEKDPRKAKRLWAIYNLVVNNKSISEVAKIFDLCFNTVRNWYRRFKDHGLDGLGDKPRSGRPRIVKLETLDKYMRHGHNVFGCWEAVSAKTNMELGKKACPNSEMNLQYTCI